MIIWRVETNGHDGPFQAREGFIPLSSALLPTFEKVWNFSESTHPSYVKDFGYGTHISPSSFFGCSSLEHLKKWFGYKNTVEYLKKHSFHVSKYETDDNDATYGKSGIQCLFDMIYATKLCDYPIEELLKDQ